MLLIISDLYLILQCIGLLQGKNNQIKVVEYIVY